MGKYDDISSERLRADLVAFARLVLHLEREGGLLESPGQLQRLLGELRRKIFAYEVRAPRLPTPRPDPTPRGPEAPPPGTEVADRDALRRESLRIVREALRREQDMIREWDGLPGNEEGDRE